jgi:hypothetical protein
MIIGLVEVSGRPGVKAQSLGGVIEAQTLTRLSGMLRAGRRRLPYLHGRAPVKRASGRSAPRLRQPGVFHRAECRFTMRNVDPVRSLSCIPLRKIPFRNVDLSSQAIEYER